jgi:hypothetical protein
MLALLGCPGNDTPNGGDDEIGDGDADVAPPPLDPLDGSGGIPPGSSVPADPTSTSSPWLAPTTLGNGLVHDSRLDLDSTPYPRVVVDVDLDDGVAWSDFVESYEDRARVGFRPAHLRARVALERAGTIASTVEIVDQSVYVADDDANYRTEIETYLFGGIEAERAKDDFEPAKHGARPVAIDTFTVEGAGVVDIGYSVAWVYDDEDLPWAILAGHSEASLTETIAEFADAGYRPISIASRFREGASEYAAIVVNDGMPKSDWAVSWGIERTPSPPR